MKFDEMFQYIQDREDCDKSCKLYDKCPYKTEGAEQEMCIIQMRPKLFSTTYNLLQEGAEGLDREIYTTLLDVKKDSLENENIKPYLDAVLKARQVIYGNQKPDQGVVDSVVINITPVTTKVADRIPDLPVEEPPSNRGRPKKE